MSREEESLVWQALETMPESYREPLILFYREDQSVAEVAGALKLSEDAVKQRLSRGREMLRKQTADLVESGLRRSRPGRTFTAGVMAGLAAQSVGTKSAGAAVSAGAGAWKAAAGAGGAAGMLGSVLGSLFGLSGGWFGTWVSAQAAPTMHARDATLDAGRRMLLFSVAFTIGIFALAFALGGRPVYLVAWATLCAAYLASIGVECVRLVRRLKRISADASPDDAPNETALRRRWTAMGKQVGDRTYRTQSAVPGASTCRHQYERPPSASRKRPRRSFERRAGRRVARGWIAIGDDARGVLLAIGSTARGFVAIGGRAFGALSFGGLAVGLVAIGGLGVGSVGIGGVGAGVYALGGVAVGWNAAAGGGAVAWHDAVGGGAVARDHAVGGAAFARHANDAEARAAVSGHPFLRRALMWMGAAQAPGAGLERGIAPGRIGAVPAR